jgi:phage terminase small subunit
MGTRKSHIQAPRCLSPEARRFFLDTVREYDLAGDTASLTLLANAAWALHRLREAEAVLRREGPTVTDRFGQVKVHPCAVRVDSENGNLNRALHELGLNLSPDSGGCP